MLQVHTFTFNPFQENTYILSDNTKRCWIIDPGMMTAAEEKALFDFIEKEQLSPQSIINTHAHIDHILGVQVCKQRYGITFGMHKGEEHILNNAAGTAMLFEMSFNPIDKVDYFIAPGALTLGDAHLKVLFVPGHSPGSIAFYSEADKFVIAGDALFNGSIGRTDLPGSNHQDLINSIQSQLYTLPDDTIVHCGHGPSTTIGQEKSTNPFVRA